MVNFCLLAAIGVTRLFVTSLLHKLLSPNLVSLFQMSNNLMPFVH